jgi:ActR/RegA family two-component response regulator
MTETSSVPIRQPREPPAAVKVAWRRFMKTLLSCGKNVASAARRNGQ